MANYEKLRLDASVAAGQELFYFSDVFSAIRNLGGPRTTVPKDFAEFAVDPASLVDLGKYGVVQSRNLYPKAELWKYFLEVAERFGLRYRAAGLTSFDALIETSYNRPDFHRRTTKRHARGNKTHSSRATSDKK